LSHFGQYVDAACRVWVPAADVGWNQAGGSSDAQLLCASCAKTGPARAASWRETHWWCTTSAAAAAAAATTAGRVHVSEIEI